MRLFSGLLFAAVLFSVIQGCGGTGENDESEPLTELLYFEPIGYGQSGSLRDTTELVIRTMGEWETYRDSLNPIAPFKPVDFSQGVVFLAALPQTTSGHIIEFVTVEERDSVTVAEYVVNAPADDCLTATAETVPFQAVMVRRTDLPVRFERDTEEYRCTFGPRR